MTSLEYRASVNKDSRGPIIVLIHGLGMTEYIWTETYKGRLLGGILPFRYVLTDLNNSPKTENLGLHDSEPKSRIKGLSLSTPMEDLSNPPEPLWRFLKERDYDLITWTQRKPNGIIEEAVKELNRILIEVRESFPGRKFILIGHSRGGLIARVYLRRYYYKEGDITGLITLSSPHHGSSLASFGKVFSPVIKALSILLPDEIGAVKKQSVTMADNLIKRLKDISRSESISELSPDSGLFKNLDDERVDHIYYATFGGTNPTFTRLYLQYYDEQSYKKKRNGYEWKLNMKELMSIPDIISSVTPKGLLPEELQQGKGDGLVSIKSAHLEWSDERYDLPLNHAMILVSPEMKRSLLDILKRLVNNSCA